MNSFSLKESKSLKEKYYHTTLENGFRITVVPKQLSAVYAMICCNFGGADLEYEKNGELFSLPAGTAHFLEHKMFESEDGSDSFLEFDKFGGNANAFTSFENTCYYFSCTDNFYENLDILLKSVSSVHFTKASVKKEKMIISREIKMYDDMPSSTVARNLSKALYFNHPTRFAVSGTVETISEITKETLERAYNDFYVPENLSLCVCGNADPEAIKQAVEKYFAKKSGSRPKTIFREEPKGVNQKRISESAQVASELYCIGIKCTPSAKNDLASYKRDASMRLLMSLLFGRASDFYCRSYESGLINERFYAGYNQSRQSAHIIISGSGSEYERVMNAAFDEIEYRKSKFFTEEQILREKKSAYAVSLTLFDSGEDITVAMSDSARLEYDEYDCIEALRSITGEDIKSALDSIDTNNSAISIILKGKDL
ncbi:MAG: insulinase family protein [Clostridia bacterium]|nr:insulinase family protein [Clostridia bacterium]